MVWLRSHWGIKIIKLNDFFFVFCFSPSVMVSMDQFPYENKCTLHKYPTFRVSSSIPSCTGTDSFAVIAAWITFYSVQEKPLLIRIIHTYTLLWKKILMNLHFPMKFIKKKSLYLLFSPLTSFKESYNVGKSITWLYNKREILSFFHWKMAFSSSFWDTSVRVWTNRACVAYLKHGGMGITRMATQPISSAPSVPCSPFSIYICDWDIWVIYFGHNIRRICENSCYVLAVFFSEE